MKKTKYKIFRMTILWTLLHISITQRKRIYNSFNFCGEKVQRLSASTMSGYVTKATVLFASFLVLSFFEKLLFVITKLYTCITKATIIIQFVKQRLHKYELDCFLTKIFHGNIQTKVTLCNFEKLLKICFH